MNTGNYKRSKEREAFWIETYKKRLLAYKRTKAYTYIFGHKRTKKKSIYVDDRNAQGAHVYIYMKKLTRFVRSKTK